MHHLQKRRFTLDADPERSFPGQCGVPSTVLLDGPLPAGAALSAAAGIVPCSPPAPALLPAALHPRPRV